MKATVSSEKYMFSNQDLKTLLIPLVIEQFLAVTIGMVDTIMVATCGEAAVSGISLVDAIAILLIGMMTALASGGAVVVAQGIGNKNKDMVSKASTQLFLAVGGIATMFMTVGLLFNGPILPLIYGGVEADVMSASRTYFYITAVSFPFLGIYNSGAALFRALGDSKISMKVSVVANLLNVAGNAFFIYVMHIGVAGAALATLISRAISGIIIFVLIKRREEIALSNDWHIDWNIMKKILYIGVPNGVENSIFQFGKILLTSLIAGFGTVATTANAVAGNVCMFQVVPANAVGVAMITVIGQCIGAGDVKQARYYWGKLLKIAYIFTILIGLAQLTIARNICGWYHLSPETTTLTIQLFVYHTVCAMVANPTSFCQANALRAANDVKFTMVVSIASMWICRIVMAYVLALYFHLGVFGVWIAMTLDWTVRSLFFTTRVLTGKWVRNMNKLVQN